MVRFPKDVVFGEMLVHTSNRGSFCVVLELVPESADAWCEIRDD
jgi:hypothetical protein